MLFCQLSMSFKCLLSLPDIANFNCGVTISSEHFQEKCELWSQDKNIHLCFCCRLAFGLNECKSFEFATHFHIQWKWIQKFIWASHSRFLTFSLSLYSVALRRKRKLFWLSSNSLCSIKCNVQFQCMQPSILTRNNISHLSNAWYQLWITARAWR